MMKMIIFDFRESEAEFFKKNEFPDFDITFISEPLNEMTILTEAQWNETDVVSIFINSSVTENVIKKFKNLRIIATRSTGYNHIDIKYCTQNNIAVFNVEHYGQKAVSEYTFGLILAVVRNMLPAYLDIQKNFVNHFAYEGMNLNTLTIGVIGCGTIGAEVAKIAHFFGMRVLVYSYMKNNEISDICDFVSFDKLLEESDIITLHIPATSENRHILNYKEFEKMKQGVFIINTARGELINVSALYENLVNGKVRGAGLDVLECEFLTFNGDDIVNELKNSSEECVTNAFITQKLLGLKNVIITPHIAYNTRESVNILLTETFNNIRDFSKGMHTNQVC